MTDDPRVKEWDLDAGVLCLDFANTANWHLSEHPEEEFTTYADLVSWNQAEQLLSATQVAKLLQEARRRPDQANETVEQAVELREAFYRIVIARLRGNRPDSRDLETLNQRLTEVMGHVRLMPADGGFRWGWEETADLRRVLWPATRSAAELLASPDFERVGLCADDRGCGWLFYDTSKNHSRRWCSMKGCGNRAKAKRHQERERADA